MSSNSIKQLCIFPVATSTKDLNVTVSFQSRIVVSKIFNSAVFAGTLELAEVNYFTPNVLDSTFFLSARSPAVCRLTED